MSSQTSSVSAEWANVRAELAKRPVPTDGDMLNYVPQGEMKWTGEIKWPKESEYKPRPPSPEQLVRYEAHVLTVMSFLEDQRQTDLVAMLEELDEIATRKAGSAPGERE